MPSRATCRTRTRAPVGIYDDPTAVLGGTWGRNQFVRAQVYSKNQTNQYFQEVEIRLRTTITPHSCTGYEVFWRCLKTDEAYAEIVRWDGVIKTWKSLTRKVGPEFGVKDGDIVEACIIGNEIRGYINGVLVTSATDDVYADGGPGVGFNFGVGDTNVDHGLMHFQADTYDRLTAAGRGRLQPAARYRRLLTGESRARGSSNDGRRGRWRTSCRRWPASCCWRPIRRCDCRRCASWPCAIAPACPPSTPRMGRLREAGAIEVETRGPLGAFMIGRSIGRLWEAAEGGPLVIALPLASSSRYEALATAIKAGLTQAGLEVFLIFVRGSRQRLQAVREGRCNLAVMSAFAAAELCGADDSVVLELWPNSYNTGHLVFYTPRALTAKPVRVLVDRHSADQQLLTALEFGGDGVTMLPAMTAQIARMLADGRGDAAVWTADEMLVNRPEGLLDRPLSPAVAPTGSATATRERCWSAARPTRTCSVRRRRCWSARTWSCMQSDVHGRSGRAGVLIPGRLHDDELDAQVPDGIRLRGVDAGRGDDLVDRVDVGDAHQRCPPELGAHPRAG